MPQANLPPYNVLCRTRAEWRAWLAANHDTSTGIWLVTFKKASGQPAPSYNDIVEEALCFGWVDSKPGKVDTERTMLYISPRKPKSGWAKPNKIRVAKLIATGQMTPAGQAVIDLAIQNGTWTMLDAIEELICPADLALALQANPTAAMYFEAFPPSTQKGIYQWIIQAKRPETRAKRVAETVQLAASNVRANQYRPPKP
jgi:uncharacterized protein YdeI (YjbR/CyaY-like superfamily)